MTSIREIRRRKNSIQSIRQITSAMKLVSAVKLQKAKSQVEKTRQYVEQLRVVLEDVVSGDVAWESVYGENGSHKSAVIVITSGKGLAGGYNSNVCRLVTDGPLSREEMVLYTAGAKGRDYLRQRGYEIARDYSEEKHGSCAWQAKEITRHVLEAFREKRVSQVYIAFTGFHNMVSCVPILQKVLPPDDVDKDEANSQNREREPEPDRIQQKVPMNYEPSQEEVWEVFLPQYVEGMVVAAFCEARASEHGARMYAMDAASTNAEEMMEDLLSQYNRARQSSITQELTEMIAGVESIGM